MQMVTNKDFEAAVKRIAGAMGRTCGELVRYRRVISATHRVLGWRPRKGTVLVASLGSSRWIVYLASASGGQGSTVIRGKKREIVDFAFDFAHAQYYRAKPKMKKLTKSRYGNVYGSGPKKR